MTSNGIFDKKKKVCEKAIKVRFHGTNNPIKLSQTIPDEICHIFSSSASIGCCRTNSSTSVGDIPCSQ